MAGVGIGFILLCVYLFIWMAREGWIFKPDDWLSVKSEVEVERCGYLLKGKLL